MDHTCPLFIAIVSEFLNQLEGKCLSLQIEEQKMKPSMLIVAVCATALLGIVRCSVYELEELGVSVKRYNKRVRPYKNIAPVEVEVQIVISALGPINTKTFTFEADLFLREFWIDPRIKIDNESVIALSGNPNSFLWVPDLFIVNAGETKIHKMVTEPICTWIHSDGRIFLSSAMKVSFACSMDLQMYPMDSQICSLEIESYAFSDQEINPIWNDNPLEYEEKAIKVAGFTVRNITTDVYNHTYLTNVVFSLGSYLLLLLLPHVRPKLILSDSIMGFFPFARHSLPRSNYPNDDQLSCKYLHFATR